ncbi:hypothetical protein GCM10009581_38080 [Tsukamurella strandjordii]
MEAMKLDGATVRAASTEDLPFLVENDQIARRSVLVEAIAAGRVIVAVYDDRPIGWLRWSVFRDVYPFIDVVEVLGPFRRRGIGRLLMEAWTAEPARARCAGVMACADPESTGYRFLWALGWQDCGALVLPTPAVTILRRSLTGPTEPWDESVAPPVVRTEFRSRWGELPGGGEWADDVLAMLVGERMYSVEFVVNDYVQMRFDGPRSDPGPAVLNCEVWPAIEYRGRTWREPDLGYADAVRGLTPGTVTGTSVRPREGLRIELDTGAVLINPAADEVYVEIAQLTGAEGGNSAWWLPGDLGFEHLAQADDA